MEKGVIQLVIDKNSGVSIHRQIVNQICTMMDSEVLKGGDRLPTERMLSEKYGIARGTVKAAYQELMRIGKIYAVQGSGTYIRETRPNIAQGNVRTLLANVLMTALKADVSYDCVVDLLRQEYEKLILETDAVKVCLVGVTHEVLQVCAKLLSGVDCVRLIGYMQDDVFENPSLIDNMDMIVTTENPYEQLLQLSGAQADKVLRLSLALDEECIGGIARACTGRRVLLCDFDSLFMEWVRDVEGMLDTAASVELIRSDDPLLSEASARHDMLILPTRDAYAEDETMLAIERNFRESGREVAHVAFHFDRGSMIHFQTHVMRVWAQKDEMRNFNNVQLRSNYTL